MPWHRNIKSSVIQEAEEVRKINFKQNLEFVDYYVNWMKTVPNEVWSKQQAKLINSLLKGRVRDKDKF